MNISPTKTVFTVGENVLVTENAATVTPDTLCEIYLYDADDFEQHGPYNSAMSGPDGSFSESFDMPNAPGAYYIVLIDTATMGEDFYGDIITLQVAPALSDVGPIGSGLNLVTDD